MKTIFFFLMVLFSPLLLFTQTRSISWEESFGGSLKDEAKSIVQTTDGGYIIAGSSWSSDGDVSGNQLAQV